MRKLDEFKQMRLMWLALVSEHEFTLEMATPDLNLRLCKNLSWGFLNKFLQKTTLGIYPAGKMKCLSEQHFRPA